jgi:hypothetical protein
MRRGRHPRLRAADSTTTVCSCRIAPSPIDTWATVSVESRPAVVRPVYLNNRKPPGAF